MKRLVRFAIWTTVALGLFFAFVLGGLWYLWSSNLPYIGSLKDFKPPIITEIFSDEGEAIGRFWNEKRIVIPLDQIPEHLVQAFVSAEDARFFQHEGIDILSIARAFIKNLLARKIEQGGSTITQQVTKSLLLKNPEKTYRRKGREAMLSLQIEKNFSKKEILFLYVNQIYLGHGAYGVEAAARTFFNKHARELSLAESALLAGLPQAPSRYSPIGNPDRVKTRQRYVLERMREDGYITRAQEDEALNARIVISAVEENPFNQAPDFTEHIRRYLEKKYGRTTLYEGGLRVYTTLNLSMQRHARAALEEGLLELDKREGYRGPLRRLSPAEAEAFIREGEKKSLLKPPDIGSVVEGLVEKVDDDNAAVVVNLGGKRGILPLSNMKWARKPDSETPYFAVGIKKPGQALKAGDLILCKILDRAEEPYAWRLSLEQNPEAQGAILTIESKTGRVKAMVGGRDFSVSQFNRVIQARRQPGSAFKPIIYAAALDKGMTPASVIIDAPYVSGMEQGQDLWRPKNYKDHFLGPTLFRNALAQSKNVITVKILKEIGIAYAIQYARKMGIESELTPTLSLALGSSGLSLLEITKAYSVFDNAGMLAEPIFIDRIEDRSGQVIEENQPVTKEVISRETAYVMTDILKAVITEGTGWRVKALKRPAAGKTGTTNDLRDAWFMGFTPGLTTGVWVGYDDRRPMNQGETGSRAASPIWLYYMSGVLKDQAVEDFAAPEGVVFAKIDAEKGLLASPYSGKTVFQAFKEGTEPTQYSPPPTAAKTGQFSEFDMGFTK